MFQWIKKLHMYAGLLAFSAVFVWGVTGIYAVFLPGPGGYEPPPISETREVPLQAPGDLDDKALAKHIYDSIDIPLRGGHYNIRRDDDANLAFFVFTASGRRDITYLEERGVVRIPVDAQCSPVAGAGVRRDGDDFCAELRRGDRDEPHGADLAGKCREPPVSWRGS